MSESASAKPTPETSNFSRGNAHESWSQLLLSDPDEPISQALFPEILFRGDQLAERHPDGASSKTDLIAETDLLEIRVSAKMAKERGSLNQIERAWPTSMLLASPHHPGMEGIRLMCGSLDGSEILSKDQRVSPDNLPESSRTETLQLLDSIRIGLCSKALGANERVTHILFSFFGVNGEDIHVSMPSSLFIRWLSAPDSTGRWARISAKGSAFSLGDGLILKRKGGDGGARGANQAQLSLRSSKILDAALSGSISGVRLYREASSPATKAISDGLSDWAELWRSQSPLRKAPIPSQAKAEIIDGRIAALAAAKGKPLSASERCLIRKTRFAPDFFLRAWAAGAISPYRSAQLIAKTLSLNSDPTNAEWKGLLHDCVSCSVLRLQGATSQRSILEGREKKSSRREKNSHMRSFVLETAKGLSSRKTILTLESIWRGLSIFGPSAQEAAKTLINAGLGAQRLLGFRNLTPDEQRSSADRLIRCAASINGGGSLSEALSAIGGQIIPSDAKHRNSSSRSARGRQVINDYSFALAKAISEKRGWSVPGKNFQIVRGFLGAAGEADRNLLVAACDSEVPVQRILPSWSKAPPEKRDKARRALAAFCSDPSLLSISLQEGEAHLQRQSAFREKIEIICSSTCAKRGWGDYSAIRLRAFLHLASDSERQLALSAIDRGLPISTLDGWGKASPLAKASILEVLAKFPDADESEKFKLMDSVRHLIPQFSGSTKTRAISSKSESRSY